MSIPIMGGALPLLLTAGVFIPQKAEAIHFSAEQNCMFGMSEEAETVAAGDVSLFSIHPALRNMAAKPGPSPSLAANDLAETIEWLEVTAILDLEESAPAEAETSDEWPLVDLLSRWQIEVDTGLSRHFAGRRSAIALD